MLRFGIVGMGIRGQLFAETLVRNPHAKLAAISDSYDGALSKAMATYEVTGYHDATEMIAKENLDGIVIATPDFLHKDPVMAAARHGVHVMIEKPFTTDMEEAEAMVQAIQEAGIKCLVAFENRWNAPFVSVKQAIEQGEIGSVVTMNARLNDTIYVPTEMLKWSSGSSPGWFLFPHLTDLAQWFKQARPTHVYAVGTKKKLITLGIDTYDSIQATVSYEDGTHAVFTTSWILPNSMPMIYDCKFEIIGDSGAMYVDLADQMVRKAQQAYKHEHTLGTMIDGRLTSAPSYMLDSFVDDILLDRTPSATEQDGWLNTKIVHAIHRSVLSGQVERIS